MFQQFSRRRVTGLLKPNAISSLQRCMANQLHGVAIPRRHEHLRRGATDPTRHLEICGDLGTKCRQAIYRGMNHVGWLHGTYTPSAEACPDLSGKQVQRRQPHLERQNRLGTKTRRSNDVVRPGHRASNRCSRLEARRHDRPRLTTGLNVTFRSQQRIGCFNRAPGQTPLLGQGACRGMRSPGFNTPLAIAPRNRS